MEKHILSELGLSEREISVYMALYTLGSTTTGPLVKLSEVQNAKIYETLDKLIAKGLATYVIRSKTKHFQAADPATLMTYYEEKRVELERLIKHLRTLRKEREPEYESRIFEGFKAIKTAFYEMYEWIGKNGKYCVFPIGEQLKTEKMRLFWAQVLLHAKDMGISIRTLPNRKLRDTFKEHYMQYDFINVRYTTQEFPTGIFIFKDHVLNVTWGTKPFATLIRSRENSKRWQCFFDQQWKNSKVNSNE